MKNFESKIKKGKNQKKSVLIILDTIKQQLKR